VQIPRQFDDDQRVEGVQKYPLAGQVVAVQQPEEQPNRARFGTPNYEAQRQNLSKKRVGK